MTVPATREFLPALRELEGRLSVPIPERVRILRELEFDLEQQSLGTIKWPLLFSALMIVGLTLWSARGLLGADASASARTKAWIDAILFWGAFAMIAGVLGTLLGTIEAANATQLAGEAPAGVVWAGIRIALQSSAIGALILALASLAWFGLQLRWRLLAENR